MKKKPFWTAEAPEVLPPVHLKCKDFFKVTAQPITPRSISLLLQFKTEKRVSHPTAFYSQNNQACTQNQESLGRCSHTLAVHILAASAILMISIFDLAYHRFEFSRKNSKKACWYRLWAVSKVKEGDVLRRCGEVQDQQKKVLGGRENTKQSYGSSRHGRLFRIKEVMRPIEERLQSELFVKAGS